MKSRIENKISRTAEVNCVLRAASFFEKDAGYHSRDHVAPQLLPKWLPPLIKRKFIKQLIINLFVPRGIYEYVIARTRYFDEITEKALAKGIDQVIVFGAGFDSRAIRFGGRNKAARFYELDAGPTQKAKIGQYRKRRIPVPENLVFLPVNFNQENARDKLVKSGFNRKGRSLFLLEGILMYLDENAVSDIFKIITDLSVPGNWLVFDFIFRSVLRGEKKYYGEADIYKRVNKFNEAWKFGIEDGEAENYFETRGFKVLDISGSRELEKKYFRNENRNLINGTHAIAWLETPY